MESAGTLAASAESGCVYHLNKHLWQEVCGLKSPSDAPSAPTEHAPPAAERVAARADQQLVDNTLAVR